MMSIPHRHSDSSQPHSPEIDEATLQDLYHWVDQIPLSRPKRNFARDFADAAMVAEIVAFYFPKIVEVHNYPYSGSLKKKAENWEVLNRKVLKKLQFEVDDNIVDDIISCQPYVIERVLIELRKRIDGILWQKHQQNTRSDVPESDQYQPSPRHIKIRKYPLAHHKQKADGGNLDKKTGHITIRADETAGVDVVLPKAAVVPVKHFERLQQECKSKDDTIVILQQKILKMEELLKLKDVQIKELKIAHETTKERTKAPKPTGGNQRKK